MSETIDATETTPSTTETDELARGFLYVAGFVFGATGLVFLVAPELAPVLREHPGASADARNDLRAIYGGMELAFGAFFVLCGRRAPLREAGLYAALLLGGIAAASRFVGFFVLRDTPLSHLAYGALDLFGAAVAAYALKKRQRGWT